MEELQSTEILEHEILEDARKKSLRILKQADDTIAAKSAEWGKKTAETIAEIQNEYNAKKESDNEKIMSRLPIDKLRSKVDRIESLLKEAIDDWYKNTDQKRIIELLSSEISKRLEICKGIRLPAKKKKVCFSGIERKDAETILQKVGLEDTGNIDLEEVKSANPYPGITIETEKTRIIVSIQNIIDYYLADKREELVEALVGRDLMERLA